ncbi:MAG: TonB-dependent receptor [Bryobacterales bacterium]|nr:TonB-dependent receptor [Bryobacterales bacterium]
MLRRIGGIAALFAVSTVLGQDFRSTLQGTVTDPTQGLVAGASVTLKNVDTALERTATTDNNGFYIFQFQPPGNYELSVKAAGFRTAVKQGIVLALTQTLREDVTLQLGDTAETVSVVADVAVVETDSAALGTAIRQEIRDNLPLKGRSSLFMFTLTPGVVNNRYGEDTRPNDTITNIFFSANGAPVAATDVFVDGAANTVNVNRGVNISQWVPAVDSIAEFKLEMGTVSAEYGRSGGSVTNMVIKSGTNSLHGTLYEFFRNSALDANGYFARGQGRSLAAFGANTYGFTLGGPVYIPKVFDGRNRTFWFTSFEGAREGNGIDNLLSVPTAKMRTGDFSEVSQTLYDPFSVSSASGTPTRTPFAGNIVPANRQDPVAQKIMTFWPTPNRSGPNAAQPWVQNYGFSGKWPRNYDMFVTKIDHRFSTAWNTFFRLNKGNGLLVFPFDFNGVATAGRNVVNRPNFGISWGNTFLLNSRTTFDVRLGYAYGKEDNVPWSDGFDLASLGFPAQYTRLVQGQAFPTIGVTGFTGLANSPLIQDVGRTYVLQSNVSQQRGKHIVKVGADLRLLYGNFFRNTNPSGSFSYSNAWSNGPSALTPAGNTGFPMASMLMGLGGGSLANNTGVSILNKYYGFFIQDDYRVTPKLTLNLGLRYEYETPRTERYDRATRGFDRSAASPLRAPGLNLLGGLVYASQNGLPRGIYDPDRNNFAPRIGFAYSVTNKTILRGGYALHYIPVVGSVDPVGYSATTAMVTSQDGFTPRDRLSNPFPAGLAAITGNSSGLATLVGQGISFVEPNDKMPMLHTWNLNIQREVFSKSLFQMGYVGSRGIHITSDPQVGISENINQVPSEALSLGRSLLEAVPNPFRGVIASGPLAGATVQRQQLLRPFPQFLDITRNVPAFGSTTYHSLQMKFEQRMWRGLTTLISYTLSKNIGDIGPYQNNYNRRLDRAVTAFDVPHRLTVTTSWDVPIGKGRAVLGNTSKLVDLMIGQWNISSFSTFQSGFPLSFGVNQNTLFLAGAGGQRPNVTGDPMAGISGSISDRLGAYFNTAAFAQPADFTFGNVGQRVPWMRSPGMNNINLTLTKQFAVTERVKVNLRASSFNLANHPVFAGPNTTFGALGAFGRISAQANMSRQTELVLRVIF